MDKRIHMYILIICISFILITISILCREEHFLADSSTCNSLVAQAFTPPPDDTDAVTDDLLVVDKRIKRQIETPVTQIVPTSSDRAAHANSPLKDTSLSWYANLEYIDVSTITFVFSNVGTVTTNLGKTYDIGTPIEWYNNKILFCSKLLSGLSNGRIRMTPENNIVEYIDPSCLNQASNYYSAWTDSKGGITINGSAFTAVDELRKDVTACYEKKGKTINRFRHCIFIINQSMNLGGFAGLGWNPYNQPQDTPPGTIALSTSQGVGTWLHEWGHSMGMGHGEKYLGPGYASSGTSEENVDAYLDNTTFMGHYAYSLNVVNGEFLSIYKPIAVLNWDDVPETTTGVEFVIPCIEKKCQESKYPAMCPNQRMDNYIRIDNKTTTTPHSIYISYPRYTTPGQHAWGSGAKKVFTDNSWNKVAIYISDMTVRNRYCHSLLIGYRNPVGSVRNSDEDIYRTSRANIYFPGLEVTHRDPTENHTTLTIRRRRN